MRYPIRFDRPTSQEQAYNDTENCLFLFGQVVHARQYSGKPVVSQSQIANTRDLARNNSGTNDHPRLAILGLKVTNCRYKRGSAWRGGNLSQSAITPGSKETRKDS
jgi:hypothetical protein